MGGGGGEGERRGSERFDSVSLVVILLFVIPSQMGVIGIEFIADMGSIYHFRQSQIDQMLPLFELNLHPTALDETPATQHTYLCKYL